MKKATELFAEAGIDLSQARSTVINWPNQVVAIVDGYRGFRGVSHGVQKDAIQNSWDARKDKKGRGWSVKFEVVRSDSGNVFVCITDEGTTGLTGRVLKREELQEDQPPEERWGRFENVAFTKDPSEEALGSRGRGKFIFVGASKISTIFYDTLRDDGVYRFGFRTIEPTESPIDAKDGDAGKELLAKLTEGAIPPLLSVGTRVIIVDPIDELLDDIKIGQFLRYISETWWEIVQKFGAEIYVVSDGAESQAKLPEEFSLPEKDSKEYKVWLKTGDKIPGTEFRIKRLHIVRNMKGPVSEDLRGVAIQRGGMKICSTRMHYVPAEVAASVYGYVTLERDLERALLPHENPEHYSFDFRRPVPKALRHYLEEQLNQFGREKLGLGVDPAKIKHERQRDAELRALYAVNRITKKLGLVGPGPGGGEKKKIRVELLPLKFPKDSRRINYGQSLKNIGLVAYNDTDKSARVRLSLALNFENTEVRQFDERDVTLAEHSRRQIGTFEHTFKKGDNKGQYTVQAVMISLRSEDKGKILDQDQSKIWLEQEPPEQRVFLEMPPLEFPRETRRINYGESLKNVRLIAHNETGNSIRVKLLLSLEYSGAEVRKFADKDFNIPAYSHREVGAFEHKFNKGDAKGKYIVRGIMISLMEADKVKELDRTSANLWVEQDPPERGIFEKVEPLEYQPPMENLMGDHYPSNGRGYIFTYNVKHPAFEDVSENEGDQLTGYLVNLMGHEVARIDLESIEPRLFKPEDLDSPSVIARKISEIVGRILHEYHSS